MLSSDISIIFFQRHIEDIVEYLLMKDKVRPSFTEHPADVFARRYPVISLRFKFP